MKCWKEHFKKHLNIQFSRDASILNTIPEPVAGDAPSTPFTIDEVEKELCHWESACFQGFGCNFVITTGFVLFQRLDCLLNLIYCERGARGITGYRLRNSVENAGISRELDV
jgi:hypothetical protein